MKACGRIDPITKSEGVSKEGRSLEEGDREGHVLKTGRSLLEEGEEKYCYVFNQQCATPDSFFINFYCKGGIKHL